MKLGDKVIFNAWGADQPCKCIGTDPNEESICILGFPREELTREEDFCYYFDKEAIKQYPLNDFTREIITRLKGEWLFVRSVDYYFSLDLGPYTLQEMLNDLEREII